MNGIPAGYKRTEVGVIPDDWKVKPINAVCKLINGRGFKPHEWEKIGLPIIRIQNLNGSDDFNFYQGSYDKKIEVEHGQLLFAWSGSRGTSFGPHVWSGPRGLLNYHTWKVQIQEPEIAKGFFLYALKQLTSFIEGRAHGASALVHTQKWEMEGFEFPLPPTKAEQEAIAEALSDADALIESLEQLVAKKRHLKQGAMQELLNGKKRLPGFSGDWEVKLLGDCLSDKPSYGINAPAVPYSDRLPVYLRITDISDDGRFSTPIQVSVNNQNAEHYYLNNGDLVFARTGASVGKSYLYNSDDGPLVFAGFLIRVRANSSLLACEFLAEFVKTAQYWAWVRMISMRSGQPGINGTELASLPIPLPTIEEQTAIATILSDMDAEITELETQLTKTRALKQGMMHKLLTGEIRLI